MVQPLVMEFERDSITYDDLLTWQLQFARTGTLSSEAQRRLLQEVSVKHFSMRSRAIVVPYGATQNA